MSAAPVTCTRCMAILPPAHFNLPDLAPCPSCETPLQVSVFPALFRTEIAVRAEAVLAEGESSCFYHPQKKSILPCDGCGRFLCALCEVELSGQHLCPACLEVGKKKGKLKNLQNERLLHDRIAFATAVLPMLFVWPTMVTGPIALYYAIRHWRSPGSLVRRRGHRLRMILAIIIGALQTAGWLFALVYFLNQ